MVRPPCRLPPGAGCPGAATWSGSTSSFADTLNDAGPCVVIAARRGDIGAAVIIDAAAFEAGTPGLDLFLRGACMSGATEAHLHRLAETAAERAAIVADLTETAAAAA